MHSLWQYVLAVPAGVYQQTPWTSTVSDNTYWLSQQDFTNKHHKQCNVSDNTYWLSQQDFTNKHHEQAQSLIIPTDCPSRTLPTHTTKQQISDNTFTGCSNWTLPTHTTNHHTIRYCWPNRTHIITHQTQHILLFLILLNYS